MVVQAQLDQAVAQLKPLLAVILDVRPEQDLVVKATWISDQKEEGNGALLWEILLDGKDLSPEQEAKVQTLFNLAGSNAMPIKGST